MCVRCDSDLLLLVGTVTALNNGDMAALCVWVMDVFTVKAVDVDTILMKSSIFKKDFVVITVGHAD